MKSNTMNLPKRLLDAASTDTTRPQLLGAFVDAKNRCIVVCDGRCLAIHPIPGDTPVKPGYISPAKWKAAKAGDAKGMTLDWAAGTLNGDPLDPPDHNGTYPDYRQVIPKFEPCYRATFNPTLIARLAASLGFSEGPSNGFTFEFDASDKSAVRITYKDKQAVIMPMNGGDNGLLVADGKAAEGYEARIAQLTAELSAAYEAKSEHSDQPAGTSASADAALIASLKSALHETRAKVRELEARLNAPVKRLDARPAAKAKVAAQDSKARREKTPPLPATAPPTVTHNAARDGIELRFNGKPDDATRLAMKEHGFRWLPGQPGQPWAAKYSEEEWLFANSLATGSAYTPMPYPVEAATAPAPVPVMPAAPAMPSRVRKIILPEF